MREIKEIASALNSSYIYLILDDGSVVRIGEAALISTVRQLSGIVEYRESNKHG